MNAPGANSKHTLKNRPSSKPDVYRKMYISITDNCEFILTCMSCIVGALDSGSKDLVLADI